MSLLKKKGKIMNEIEKELQEIREKKRVIPATFDPVFKSLLTNENNRDYLEDLISYVTKIPKEIISKNMVVVNNQLPIEKYNNKQLNTDILVEIEKNVINLEMNAQKEIGIFEKNAAYYQKLMVDQYKRSADYRNIKRVIQINFNDFKYFSDEDIIIKFQMTSENGLYIDPIYGEVYHVNLAILKKFWYNEGKKQSLNDFDLKLLMLCASERETLDELAERDESLMNVKKNIEELSDDEDIIGLYDVKKAAEWEKNCTKAYFEELEKDIKKYDEDVKKHEEDVKKHEEDVKKYEKDVKKQEKDVKKYEEDVKKQEKDVKKYEEDVKKQQQDVKKQEENIRKQQQEIEKQKEDIRTQQQEIEKQKEDIRKQEEETRKKELDQEKKQKLEIAKNLLKENIDIDIILKVTSLKKEDIKGLNF